jgi:hypothetical protein
MQGYNAQAVCNENQIVVAAEINADSPDFGHLDPMVSAAERELAGAGIAAAPAVVVADAGYWHHDQMDQLAGRGIPVLIPPDAGKRRGARPGWDGGRSGEPGRQRPAHRAHGRCVRGGPCARSGGGSRGADPAAGCSVPWRGGQQEIATIPDRRLRREESHNG